MLDRVPWSLDLISSFLVLQPRDSEPWLQDGRGKEIRAIWNVKENGSSILSLWLTSCQLSEMGCWVLGPPKWHLWVCPALGLGQGQGPVKENIGTARVSAPLQSICHCIFTEELWQEGMNKSKKPSTLDRTFRSSKIDRQEVSNKTPTYDYKSFTRQHYNYFDTEMGTRQSALPFSAVWLRASYWPLWASRPICL